MNRTFTFLLFTFYFLTPQLKAQVNVGDSLALVDLYNSTNGSGWNHNNNWLTKKPVSKWFGITVENNFVKTINLEYNNLNGPLPQSIGNFDSLQYIFLHNNHLNGQLPGTIGNLSSLMQLFLSSNNFTGEIPNEIGNLSSVIFLELGTNQFSGSIPSSIGNLTNVSSISFANNLLTGKIPKEIGNMKSLKYIDLFDNKLSGSIPSSIGKLSNALTLYLNDNQLTGEIPTSIGNLNQLAQLQLSNNHLSGTIPFSLGNLTNIQNFYCDNNNLSGEIPHTLGKWKYVSIISLTNNKLTGSIPQSLSRRKNIYQLILTGNMIDALPIPVDYVKNQTFVDNNKLNFSDLEPVINNWNLSYAPQKNISINQSSNILSVSAGGTLSNNTYKWYKNGILVQTKTGDSSFTTTGAGTYYATVTNSIVTNLTLQSDSLTITAPIAFGARSTVNGLPSFLLSPNPAKDFITLSFPQNISSAIAVIYDINGKQLMKQNIISSTQKININSLSSGEYVLYILYDGKEERQKLIMEYANS